MKLIGVFSCRSFFYPGKHLKGFIHQRTCTVSSAYFIIYLFIYFKVELKYFLQSNDRKIGL